MKYRIEVKVTCPEVPPIEDLPPYLMLEYNREDGEKSKGIKETLIFMAYHWDEFFIQRGPFKIEDGKVKFLDNGNCGCCPNCQEGEEL
jgi:hypothetical protein